MKLLNFHENLAFILAIFQVILLLTDGNSCSDHDLNLAFAQTAFKTQKNKFSQVRTSLLSIPLPCKIPVKSIVIYREN